MNRLSTEKRSQIVACLIEGNSIRATSRFTGVARGTVLKLLVDLGDACSLYQHQVMRDLPCERLQADEIWSLRYSKAKNAPADKEGEFGYGDVWTWTAICADTKLVPSWYVGKRDSTDAYHFLSDLAGRLAHRVQVTTDSHRAYLRAVEVVFEDGIDYAQLHKLYGSAEATRGRYSPPKCIGAMGRVVKGSPDPDHLSTSYVERQNLTMRMGIRGFTRLTNAFSKKIENLTAAVSVHFMHYNFCRVHTSLSGKTTAMAAGVTDHVWTLQEMIGVLETAEAAKPRKRRPYQRRPVSN